MSAAYMVPRAVPAPTKPRIVMVRPGCYRCTLPEGPAAEGPTPKDAFDNAAAFAISLARYRAEMERVMSERRPRPGDGILRFATPDKRSLRERIGQCFNN